MPFSVTHPQTTAAEVVIPTLLVLVVIAGMMTLGAFALARLGKDIKARDPKNAPLWIALILFFGPLGVLAWRIVRPDPPDDQGPG